MEQMLHFLFVFRLFMFKLSVDLNHDK